MDILVSERITGRAMDALRSEFDVVCAPELWNDPAQLEETIADARALIARNQTRVSADLIAAAPKLCIIGRAGAGLDNIDTEAASEAGIVVTYAPRENSVSVAELTVGLMLALAREIPAAHGDTAAGGWNRSRFTGIELSGKTLGVVGLGRIGTLVAQRAKAFGMRILAHDDYVASDATHVRDLGAQLVPLDELLRSADFVACHVPLTAETRGMFDAERFRRMKPTAMFVNTSRGEVVDETALAAALRNRQIRGAALDVRTVEPPPRGLFDGLDNVILTPHIAAFTCEAQERVVAAVCHDVAAVLRGGTARHAFNFAQPRRRSIE